MIKWLDMIKHQVEESTYTGYKRQIEGRLKKYFTEHWMVLRHSCATLLVKKGISLREIQDWLGHSSSKTTERYAHLDLSSKIKSASAIEKALSFSTYTENERIKKDILDQDSNTSTLENF